MRCGERVRLDSRFSAWLAWKHRRCGGVFAPDPELAGLGSATIHPAGQPTGVDYEHCAPLRPVREDRIPACQPGMAKTLWAANLALLKLIKPDPCPTRA